MQAKYTSLLAGVIPEVPSDFFEEEARRPLLQASCLKYCLLVTECQMQCATPEYWRADYEDPYYDLFLKCAHGCAKDHKRYEDAFTAATVDTPGWPNYDLSDKAAGDSFWKGAKGRCQVRTDMGGVGHEGEGYV